MWGNSGYWQAITYGAKTSPLFVSFHACSGWANQKWGLGNWTYQWIPIEKAAGLGARMATEKEEAA